MLPQIRARFRQLLARHRGEISADVKSAPAQRRAGRRPQSHAGRPPTAKAAFGDGRSVADRRLLSFRVGSKMIDSSLKTKLANLKTVLTEA